MNPVSPAFRLLASTLFAALALACSSATASNGPATPITYRSIPLDCGGWFSGFAMHSSGRLYGFGDVFGMWRSDDSGLSWKYLQGDFTTSDQFVNGCAVAAGNRDHVVFLGSKTVFKSHDGGATWAPIMEDISSRRDRGATPVIFHPAQDRELWLATARNDQIGSLWRSTDGGSTWRKAGGPTFDEVVATGIYIRPEFPDQIWVGAVGGLYVSADRGVTFTRVWDNTGGVAPFIGPKPTVGGMVRRADGVGYIATNTKGWRITATNYADPSTYRAVATVSWWSGWGPSTASVLADGSFLTNGPREPGRPDSDPESLMRSTDGGLTWKPLPMRLLTPPTPSWHLPARPDQRADGGRDMIVQDPANPNRWHMTGGGAPVISEDAGATWRFPPNANGLAGVPTFKVRFARTNPELAFIPGSDHGGFIVTDGGRSGEVFSSIRTSVDKLQTHHQILSNADGTVLVAAGVDQTNTTLLLRSTDSGATWTQPHRAPVGLPPSSEGITRAIAAPGNIDDFLVLLGKGGAHSHPGLYRTIDGGATFRSVGDLPPDLETGMRYHPENAWLETDGIHLDTRYLSLRSAPNLPTNHVWRSRDGGDTWAPTRTEPFRGEWISCLAVDHFTASRLWVASGRGLKRSNDGGDTWVEVGDFSSAKRIDAARGHLALWGRRPGDEWEKLYYSADDGATWTEQTGPGHRFANLSDLAINPHKNNEIWISGMSVNILTASTNPPAHASAAAPLAASTLPAASPDNPFPEVAAAPDSPPPSASALIISPGDDVFPDYPAPATPTPQAAASRATDAPAVDDVFPPEPTTPADGSVQIIFPVSDPVFPDGAAPAPVLPTRAEHSAQVSTEDDLFPAGANAAPVAPTLPNPLLTSSAVDDVFPPEAPAAADPMGVVFNPFPEGASPAPVVQTAAHPAVATPVHDDVFPVDAPPASAPPKTSPLIIASTTDDDVFPAEVTPPAPLATTTPAAVPAPASVVFTPPPPRTATTPVPPAPPRQPAALQAPGAPVVEEETRPQFRGPKNRPAVPHSDKE